MLWPASSRKSPIFGGDAYEVRSGEVRFELLARAPVLVEGEEVGVLHALVQVVVDVPVLPLGRLNQSSSAAFSSSRLRRAAR
jgi:hypothetical protein